jgi:hypothetical protein
MSRHCPTAEAMNVVNDVPGLPCQRISGWALEIEGDEMTALCAQFRGVDAQHAAAVHRGIEARRVTVIGEDDEMEASARRGCSNLVE